MSGVNGNVIMSGCGDDNPDNEGREEARDNTESVSRGADGSGGGGSDRGQRAAVLTDKNTDKQARGEGGGHGNRGRPRKRKTGESEVKREVQFARAEYRT